MYICQMSATGVIVCVYLLYAIRYIRARNAYPRRPFIRSENNTKKKNENQQQK